MPKKSVKKAVVRKAVEKSSAKKVTKRGGKQPGAGRPKGSGKYGCETKAMRIPTHLHEDVQAFVMKKIKAEAKK